MRIINKEIGIDVPYELCILQIEKRRVTQDYNWACHPGYDYSSCSIIKDEYYLVAYFNSKQFVIKQSTSKQNLDKLLISIERSYLKHQGVFYIEN